MPPTAPRCIYCKMSDCLRTAPFSDNDFAAIAMAMGAQGMTVQRVSDLDRA